MASNPMSYEDEAATPAARERQPRQAESERQARPERQAESERQAQPRQARPAKPDKPARSAKPAKPAKLGKPTKPGKPTKSAKFAKPGKPAKPAKPGKPTKPTKPAKPTKSAKPYVGDYGAPIESAGTAITASFGMVLLALAIGFVIGFLVFAALWLSSALTDLIWHGVTEGDAPWFMPILLCTAGGLIIGLWSKYIGGDPEPLMEVLAEVKKTGSYRLRSIPASVVAFLLPLAFGGSVGLEAGLTGLIVAACSYIGRTLRAAGLRVKGLTDMTVAAAITAIFGTPIAGIVMTSEDAMPDVDEDEDDAAADTSAAADTPAVVHTPAADGNTRSRRRPDTRVSIPNPDSYTFRRGAKILLYSAAAFGSIGGLWLLTALTGGLAGIPRFEAVAAEGVGLLWSIPCLILAYAMVLLHHASEKGTRRLAQMMERFTVLKPLVVGVIIGCIAVALPNVLFCGEEQGFQIQENWQAVGVAVLLGTGIVKVAATSLCLNMGWNGGNFFPNIYAGISAGYGMALLTGADPMLCVTVVTSAYLGGMFRRPLMVLALLILCFPLHSILWMGLACVIGATLPIPSAIAAPEGEA